MIFAGRWPAPLSLMIVWHRLFPDEDYRFRMAIMRGDAETFFAPSENRASLLELRRASLSAQPERYIAALSGEETRPMLDEATLHMAGWSGMTELQTSTPQAETVFDLCLAAGKSFEPDWLLSSPEAEKNHPVIAGVVCFPSSWSLAEKIGRPLFEVHQAAPTLNEDLGRSINTFLARLKPGDAWQRQNWGLSTDDVLDHHPDRDTLPLTKHATLSTTWLRLEDQILIRLPATCAILFGIRVTLYRLDTLAAVPGIAPRIARALRTMPDQIAAYKGISHCRQPLINALEAVS
jgi:hypothetical protein